MHAYAWDTALHDSVAAAPNAFARAGEGPPLPTFEGRVGAPWSWLLQSQDLCCGPEGRRWFLELPGLPCPAAPLGGGGAVSTTIGGRFRGARFLGRAVGPFCTGDRAPESAVCGGWRRSRVR